MESIRYPGAFVGRSLALGLMFCLAEAHAVTDDYGAAGDTAPDSVTDIDGDFIFGGGMEQMDGGTSCATATKLHSLSTYVSDTTDFPDWIFNIGPIPTPAHDTIYSFMPGPGATGKFTPVRADYDFLMYVIGSCNENGHEPSPLASTSTVGEPIDMEAAGLVMFQRYYLVITGLPSAGATANGAVRFTTPWVLAIDPNP
jgi:hypothetical protein